LGVDCDVSAQTRDPGWRSPAPIPMVGAKQALGPAEIGDPGSPQRLCRTSETLPRPTLPARIGANSQGGRGRRAARLKSICGAIWPSMRRVVHARHGSLTSFRSVVIDQIDIGDVLTLNPRVALAMDDRFLARGEITRQLPEIDTDHWPARSPRRGCSRKPGSAMSDGTEAVASAASTARNRFKCWVETPLVSPSEYSRSSPLWRKRRIAGGRCGVPH
jgi:hypothetical protein